MPNLSKTAALKQAQKAVSTPCKLRKRYAVYGPTGSNLRRCITEVNATTYSKALSHRAVWVASIALRLMGIADSDTADYADIDIYRASGNAKKKDWIPLLRP